MWRVPNPPHRWGNSFVSGVTRHLTPHASLLFPPEVARSGPLDASIWIRTTQPCDPRRGHRSGVLVGIRSCCAVIRGMSRQKQPAKPHGINGLGNYRISELPRGETHHLVPVERSCRGPGSMRGMDQLSWGARPSRFLIRNALLGSHLFPPERPHDPS